MPRILRSKCKKSADEKHVEGLSKPKKKNGVWGKVRTCANCEKAISEWRPI